MKNIGQFYFSRTLINGNLICDVMFEIPFLENIFKGRPAIFRDKFIVVASDKSDSDDVINILRQIQRKIDWWIKYIEGVEKDKC